MASLIEQYVQRARAPLSTPEQDFLKMLDGGVPLVKRSFLVPEQLWDEQPGKFRFRFRGAASDVELDWSSPLERQLYQRRIRMESTGEEAARGGTLLLFNMEFTDVRYGRAFSDAVLHEVLRERFSQDQRIMDVLQRLKSDRVPPSDDHDSCKSYQEDAISGLRNSLSFELGYDLRAAPAIFIAAIWYLLAKRHWAIVSLTEVAGSQVAPG